MTLVISPDTVKPTLYCFRGWESIQGPDAELWSRAPRGHSPAASDEVLCGLRTVI